MERLSIAECKARWARLSDSEREQEYLSLCRIMLSFIPQIPDWLFAKGMPTSINVDKVNGDAGLEQAQSHIAVNDDYMLSWEGATWFVKFRNEMGRIRNLVGVRYLAVLLAHPESSYPPIKLAQACGRFKEPERLHHVDRNENEVAEGYGFSFQSKTDPKTIEQVRRRFKELQESRTGSPFEDLALKEEIEALDRYLRQNVNGVGRTRTFRRQSRGLPSAGAVGNAITDCVKEMAQCGLPALSQHLKNCIRPYKDPISYLPDDTSISWFVAAHSELT